MSFQHSSSISSEDDFIDSRLKSLVYRDPYNHHYFRQHHSVNRHKEYLPYSKDKRQRQGNISRRFNIERSRRTFEDIISQYSETDSDEEIDYLKFDRSRNARNLSPSRSNRWYHLATDVYQACQVMIIYKKDSLSSSKNDQILIEQKQNYDHHQRIIVYKGYLKKDDIFLFKSQHLAEYPFDVKFYVNGHIEGHLLTCCEYKYRRGGVRIGKIFIIQQIEKSIPCHKCRRHQQKENEEIRLNSSDGKRVLSDHQSLKIVHSRTSEEETNTTDDEQIQENGENNDVHSTTSIDQNKNDNDTQSQQENIRLQNEINESNDSPKTENENNFSNEFRRMLMERTTSDTDNSGNLFQSLLSLFQNNLRQMEIREPLPSRYQGNVENFVVILLGIDDKSNIIHSIVNFVKILNNIEQFNSFIVTLKFEKIILIINDQLFESIEDLNRFHSIYLLSNNFKWIKKSSNIRGHFSNIKLIFEKIKEEFLIENHLFSIESVPENETQNQSFSYSQLLKETLLTKDDEGNLKKDFIDFSRFHYYNNQIQLNLIDEFQTDFTLEKSIWWFTRNSFIRKMLNRALRTEEIDILFKMRWIIQAINNQIKQNHFSKIVYRIHHLSSNQFQKLKEHSGGLISFGTFLDCSLNEPSEIENINEMETILFRIKTTNGIETEQLRHFDSKTEILLPLDNVYHIESIEKSNKNCWIISLINLNKDNQQFKELTNSMREDIQGPVVLIQLGKLLISNNDYLHADYLARLLFNDNSLKDNPTLLASLAALHHLLGSVDNRLNNYRAARLQFEQSLKIFLTFISEDNQILSATYNNIGSMFYQEDQHDQAIIYHQKALQCQLKASSPDIEAIATYSGNIGAVYLDQRKYDQALLNYKRSLQILQQSTPGEESQSIAMVYDRIASVYWRMDQPDQALPYYQKALQLELKYLPQNHHKISVSYFNLSTAYAKLNRLDDAIDCAEKSVQQLLKSVPPDHPEVKENTTQLEGLRRRKLLQQIYQ